MGSGAPRRARTDLLSGSHHGPFGKIEEIIRTDPQWPGTLSRPALEDAIAPDRIGRLTAAAITLTR